MVHSIRNVFLFFILSVSSRAIACNSDPAVVLLQMAKESVEVEGEKVEFSTLPGTTWSTKMDIEIVEKVSERVPDTAAAIPVPGGLSHFEVKRKEGPNFFNEARGEVIATLPNKKIITIHLNLKAMTKSCGSHSVKYD